MNRLQLLLVLAALALTWSAYAPGLAGPFLADDHPNITGNKAVRVHELRIDTLTAAAASGRAGPVMRPLSMMTFAVNHAVSGLNPRAFKTTNLVVHILAGLCLAQLTYLLLSRVFWRHAARSSQINIAILVAAIWLLHPLQLTNVLYVVQRMNSLSGLFSLAALLCHVAARFGPDGSVRGLRAGPVAATALFAIAATLCKENGVLVLAYIAAVELAARYAIERPRHASGDAALLTAFGLAVATAAGMLSLAWDELIRAYANRDFTLRERLLTEARVLVWYLRLIVAPDLSEMGLLHDDWTTSTSLVRPITTLLSILALAALAAAAWLLRTRFPIILFGVLWFYGGHIVESTVWPLVLVFEHRNYLPSYGIILALALPAAQGLSGPRSRLAVALLAIAAGAVFSSTRIRAHAWSDEAVWIQTQARNHPDSASAHFLKAVLFAQFAGYVSTSEHRSDITAIAAQSFDRALELNPRDASPLLARAYHWVKLGRPLDENDLVRAAYILRHHAPVPAQNAVLTYCEQITEGGVPYIGATQDVVFGALLGNARTSHYISTRLRTCVQDLERSQTRDRGERPQPP